MSSRSIFLSLLPLSLLLFQQTPDPNGAHIKEWTERHAQYSAPKITQTDSSLEITANDPRPLDSVLAALAHQHGWHINYEDPKYGKADLVDDTAPSWLQEHPNGGRVYAVVGGAFFAKIPIDGYFPYDPVQILPTLVEAYNRSGNPGRFALHTINHDSFDIVPTAAAGGPQAPLLDTVMSFDATDMVPATELRKFCEKLSRVSGQTVVFDGSFGLPMSAPQYEVGIKQHSQNQAAREILREIYRQVGSTYCWRLFYDTDSNQFVLQLRW